jgi:hypothetical protein
MGFFLKIFLRKNASAEATIKPINAKASVKKLRRLVSSASLSTLVMLYSKMMLKTTQMITIFNTI